jgi:mono/diheme cytochrome c family protein
MAAWLSRWAGRAALVCAGAFLCTATIAATTATTATTTPAVVTETPALARGRAVYNGEPALPLAQGDGLALQACVGCHRPSGLGNFEGGLAVPPIAGPTLFKPLDRDTARFFPGQARYRIRPAYDEAGLARLLRTGITPDGVTIHAAMPRLKIDDAQLADLVAYLRGLSATPSPGLTPDEVHLATISTPDADPQRRAAMLATLSKFIAQKNGQSRHEAQRSTQSSRTREMAMYTKFRVWRLEHWALQGAPETWAAQLAQRQAAQPVFAVVGGIGRADWAPVDAFCERMRLPCLLPLVEAGAGPAAPGFYGLHYHAGIDADAALAARVLRERGLTQVQLWGEPAAQTLHTRVAAALRDAGLVVTGPGAQAIVSLLAPAAHAERLKSAGGLPVVWLAGTHALGQAELGAATQGLAEGWIVTPMRSGAELDRQLQRARFWMQQQGLSELPADVVASTLQAATVLGEGLAHMDFGFTREYLLELLEHSLENVIPWSPYPRLAIGPEQRIASRRSQLGEIHDGVIAWRSEAVP